MPHVARARVRREKAEAAVGQYLAPRARRQPGERYRAVVVPVHIAPRGQIPPVARRGQQRQRAARVRHAGADGRSRRHTGEGPLRHEVHAAGRIERVRKVERREPPAHLSGRRLLIVPAVAAAQREVARHAKRAQQRPLPQHAALCLRAPHRQVARDALRPERGARQLLRHGVRRHGREQQGRDRRHRVIEFRPRHAVLRRELLRQCRRHRGRQHERALRRRERIVLARAHAERKAHAPRRVRRCVHRYRQLHAPRAQPPRHRPFGPPRARPVARGAQPRLRLLAAAEVPQQQRVAPLHALKAQPRERRVVDIILPRCEHGLKHEPHRALDPARGRERQRAHLAVGAAGHGQRLHGGHVPVPGGELRRAHREAPLRPLARQQRAGEMLRLQPHDRPGGGVCARAAAADAQRVPAREALPGFGHGEAVRAVREQRAARGLGINTRALGRIVRQGAAARLFGRLLCPPPQRRRAQRQPLGQQGRVRAHGGVGEEPPPHLISAQRVARRQQAHALVVRHHAAHDLPAAARARAGAVERVEKSVLPQQPERREFPQVAHRRARLHRQREKAAVRREHELFVHARLQGQRRAAVRLVAVAQRAVEREVRALRHAPHLPRMHAPPLHVEAELCALPQQGVAHRRQKQLRHQVLEHRP